jgi:hypothetical protein
MNDKSPSKKGSPVRRTLKAVINPFSPITSFKNTVGDGATVIRDLHAEVAKKRKNPTIRTFEEAMAMRPVGALPLSEIEKTNLNSKRIAIFFAVLSFVYSIGSLVPQNYSGAILGMLFAAFSLLVALKHSHRVWQVRHRNLISVKEFMRRPGWLTQTLNPELFN